jgi:hypothetical protein
MAKNNEIIVKDVSIKTMTINGVDYICITDIARQKNATEPKDVVKNWMRQKNTLEYLGLWEKLNNPNFKGVEFDPLLAEADVLNVAMFGMTAKQWREANPELKGNIRDYATINELICLSNMENINAVLINEGLPQGERLLKLNQIAIQQMQVLEGNSGRNLLK